MPDQSLTGRERTFPDHEFLVSKTDPTSRITYANRTFVDISGYTQRELFGSPHKILRHPDMPKTVFRLMWDHIEGGDEIFAYVVNRCKNGDHYWVNAHVTPSFDTNGTIIGYHSNRRVPDRETLEKTIIPLYQKLREIEASAGTANQGIESGLEYLQQNILSTHRSYDDWILSLSN
jgi:PAS domain S-box-containing protein